MKSAHKGHLHNILFSRNKLAGLREFEGESFLKINE